MCIQFIVLFRDFFKCSARYNKNCVRIVVHNSTTSCNVTKGYFILPFVIYL